MQKIDGVHEHQRPAAQQLTREQFEGKIRELFARPSELVFGVNDDERLDVDDMDDDEEGAKKDDDDAVSFEDIEIEFESEGEDDDEEEGDTWRTGQGGR